MVLHDAPRPYDPRVFERGHPGRPGEPVPRQMVRIANPARKPFASAGSGRLDLAREIVSKDNPLTARVFVNRVWLHHFGRGLKVTRKLAVKMPTDLTAHLILGWVREGGA